MTREEAISTLKSLKDYYNDKNEYGHVEFDDEDNEAFDMAIKSLEQEPCEDCISRADALSDKGLGVFHYYEDYARMRNYLKNLPPVTPKPETVTEFADRCKECGTRYGKLLKDVKIEKIDDAYNHVKVYCVMNGLERTDLGNVVFVSINKDDAERFAYNHELYDFSGNPLIEVLDVPVRRDKE